MAKAPGPLRPYATEVDSRLQLIAAVPWNASGTMRAWVREFRGIWSTVKRASGEAASGSAGRQTEERLDALLEELSQSLADSRHLDGHAVAAQLAAAAARTHFEPASGDVSVTLSSALGDPIVRYDGIWVTGLDADSWPPPARLDPFIPAVAQRAAGMTQTSAALLAREAEARMDSWARATPELVLSWPRMQEGIEQRASPLVSRLFKSERFEAPRPQLSLAERQCRPGRLERFDDARGAPWDFERIPSLWGASTAGLSYRGSRAWHRSSRSRSAPAQGA